MSEKRDAFVTLPIVGYMAVYVELEDGANEDNAYDAAHEVIEKGGKPWHEYVEEVEWVQWVTQGNVCAAPVNRMKFEYE